MARYRHPARTGVLTTGQRGVFLFMPKEGTMTARYSRQGKVVARKQTRSHR